MHMNTISPVGQRFPLPLERKTTELEPAMDQPRLRRLHHARPADTHAVLTYGATARPLEGSRPLTIDIYV